MIYFKTVNFPDHIRQPQIETALRKSAIKKTWILDFERSIIDINRDKDFLGFEDNASLTFTRTKISLEFLLPKVIISVSKNPLAKSYKMRLGAVPFSIFLMVCIGLFAILVNLLKGIIDAEATVLIFGVAILFLSALIVEIKMTKSRVAKSLKNHAKVSV